MDSFEYVTTELLKYKELPGTSVIVAAILQPVQDSAKENVFFPFNQKPSHDRCKGVTIRTKNIIFQNIINFEF
ncbi:hypothetical protein AGMMS49921_10150 [Endomicrobiia bacterium]|nr:hypothetical protein AGMMS49921_10150 [Endomicrobiia bacterium]